MNDNLQPLPNEHLEARITAWVLGQASPFEEAELEALCAADPELQLFLNRTKALHALLLETPPSSSDQFWKLSAENREKLDPIIGSNHSTPSNKPSGIRRAAYRAAFGIAAVLTFTLFIKRIIFAPLSSDKEASNIVSFESTNDEVRFSHQAKNEVFFDKTASDGPSKSIATSSPRKPSAPSASAPAPASERDTTLALLDSKFKNKPGEKASGAYDESAGEAPRLRIINEELDVTKAEQKPSALSDDRFAKAEAKKQEAKQNAMARNVPEEEQNALADNGVVNDGGIGYGSGGGQSDMSNTVPGIEASSPMSKVIAESNMTTIPVPNVNLSEPSVDYGDGKDLGGGWGGAKDQDSDAFAANDGRQKGGFTYEAEKFKNPTETAAVPSIPNETARSTGSGTIEGLRSGDYAIQRESVDAILNNPERSLAANKEAERGPSTNAPVGGISFSNNGLVQREIARRQNNITEADKALMDGREAYTRGDLSKAADKYKEALAALPDTPAPALEDRRQSYSQHLSDVSVAQAQQMRKVGKYDEARKLLEQAETLSPSDATIKKELAYLNDPIRTNPAGTFEHVEKVDQVRRDLYKAEGNFDLGKYDDAKKSYEDILRVDPYNEAARRGMEKIADTKSEYYRAAYDQTRSELLAQVDRAWELAVPAEGEMNDNPLSATAQGGIANLRESGMKKDLSALLEADVADHQKNNSAPGDAVGFLKLTEDENAPHLSTRSGAEKRDSSIINEFQYPTEYETPVPGNVNPAVDPFAAWGGVSISGQTFASPLNSKTEGEKDIQGDGYKGFANLEAPADGEPKQVKITTKFVEITQENNEELGFDWLLRNENQKANLGLATPAEPSIPNIESHLTGFTGDVELPILGDLPMTGRLFQEGEKGKIIGEAHAGYNSEYLYRGLVVGDQKKPSLIDLSNELSAAEEAFSTFSLNISDASFQLALAAIEKGERPDPASIKPEQFYNAVDYGDPAPSASEPVAAAIDQTAHPVIPGRNLVRVALRTGSTGRSAAQPLRLTLLVDQSGSMVRADRRVAMETALAQLATLLTEHDQVTVIGFSRTPHLLAQSLPGNQAAKLPELINQTASEGGTNLEQAINLATEQALSHHLAGAQNRIVLFTDGAANLGDADPDRLSEKIKNIRQQGLAFDIAGIGTNDVNDKLLSDLARHGNGRYYLVGEKTAGNLAAQLAGAFRPAAENVKVQVKLNPQRVGNYKLIGFEKDRLKTEDFRNDAVDAAELAADEAGVALYQVETLPEGTGEIGEVSVRFRDTVSGEMVERTWTIPYDASAPSFDKANPKTQLATLALLAAQKLQTGPLADAINFSNHSETIAKLKQANANSAKTQQLLNLINAIK